MCELCECDPCDCLDLENGNCEFRRMDSIRNNEIRENYQLASWSSRSPPESNCEVEDSKQHPQDVVLFASVPDTGRITGSPDLDSLGRRGHGHGD